MPPRVSKRRGNSFTVASTFNSFPLTTSYTFLIYPPPPLKMSADLKRVRASQDDGQNSPVPKKRALMAGGSGSLIAQGASEEESGLEDWMKIVEVSSRLPYHLSRLRNVLWVIICPQIIYWRSVMNPGPIRVSHWSSDQSSSIVRHDSGQLDAPINFVPAYITDGADSSDQTQRSNLSTNVRISTLI